MIAVVCYLLILCILIGTIYLLAAKSIFIKILTFGYLNNIIIAFISLYALFTNNFSYLDVALIYAILAQVSTIIIVKYMRGRK